MLILPFYHFVQIPDNPGSGGQQPEHVWGGHINQIRGDLPEQFDLSQLEGQQSSKADRKISVLSP